MVNFSERLEFVHSFNHRFFYHVDFEKRRKVKTIVSDIPDKGKLDDERVKVASLRVGNKSPEMRPCYEEPLLTKDQEYHLFRKMNYFKFKLKKMKARMPIKPSLKHVEKMELLIKEISFLRNQIASSNFRLATHILKTEYRGYVDSIEACISNAYMDVIKSVDYFNYTKGFKFSTYCVWVLKKNFFRSAKLRSMKKHDVFCLDELPEDGVDGLNKLDNNTELHQRENELLVKKIIDQTKKSIRTVDVERQIMIIEHYYGINGKQRKNLHEISCILNITKERVRQLKEKFLKEMRNIVELMGCRDVI
jgi:RNA polymerase sigma factor (sigma-70 family)